MPQITHNNHYVPQFYLKQWSKDGHRVWAYRLLVSHENIKEWDRRAISNVAVHRDLYTEIEDGKDVDDFERFLEAEFESPAKEVLTRVRNNWPLTSYDWEKLARFYAAQDVRTPTSYLEAQERWPKMIPDLLQTTLEKFVKEVEKSKGQSFVKAEGDLGDLFQKSLKIQVVRTPETGGGYIKAEVETGRKLWLQFQRMVLTKTIHVLLTHKWSIAQPATGMEFFTTDRPAVRLNYYGNENYDLRGGWGSNGTDLLMPLSPYHLLFTNIGKEFPDRTKLSVDETVKIQKILADGALRWVFARKTMKEAVQFRPRMVDAIAFKSEDEQLRKWHLEQSESEKRSDRSDFTAVQVDDLEDPDIV